MAGPPERSSNRSGISEQEAREFHGYFTSLTTVFVGIALVAHLLMWMWRPWLGN
jgi:light-harvesting complex 1 beta chain